jgi:hypothetical protein
VAKIEVEACNHERKRLLMSFYTLPATDLGILDVVP